MAKIRVRKLARELGLSNKQVVERLAEAGVSVGSHRSFVDEAAARAALSTIETSERKLPEEATRDESATKPKRAKRTKKSKKNKKNKKKTKPVAEPQADLEPSREAPKEVPGIKPEPISLPTSTPTEPLPTSLQAAETPAEPPTELEPPQVDAHPPEVPVMEESAPEEEQHAHETEEAVAPTEPPGVDEALSPAITLKPGQEPELVKRVADELGFDLEEIPGATPEGKDPSPVSKVVRIPEMVTVRELAEKLAISPGKIIKELKKMGIVATLDWSLNPGLSKRVAAEFGFDVEVTRVEDLSDQLRQQTGELDFAETGRADDTLADQDRALSDAMHRRIKLGLVKVKVRSGEQEHHAPSSPAPAIPTEKTRPVPPVRQVTKELSLLAGAIVMVAFVVLGVSRNQGTQSSGAPGATASSNGEVQRVAAIPTPKVEKPTPPPSPKRGVWKVVHHLPRADKTEQSPRRVIRIFFNRPVEPDVVERAFAISPHASGTFSWPKPDRLVFTPSDSLLPATEYTVSMTSISGSQQEEEYTLHEARWSFSTRDKRTYRKDVKPLIAAYCSTCHSPNGTAAGIPLETYRDVRRYVVQGRSVKSPLYTFLREEGHTIIMGGSNQSTHDKIAVIKDWIDEDGAAE